MVRLPHQARSHQHDAVIFTMQVASLISGLIHERNIKDGKKNKCRRVRSQLMTCREADESRPRCAVRCPQSKSQKVWAGQAHCSERTRGRPPTASVWQSLLQKSVNSSQILDIIVECRGRTSCLKDNRYSLQSYISAILKAKNKRQLLVCSSFLS